MYRKRVLGVDYVRRLAFTICVCKINIFVNRVLSIIKERDIKKNLFNKKSNIKMLINS